LDALPTANTGTIEGHALGEGFFVDKAAMEGAVLPDPEEIDKLQVDHLDILVLNHFQDILGSRHERTP